MYKGEVPTDAGGVRRLLGVCGYYRRYYPQPFARHTGVLTRLLQKDPKTGFDVKFEWGPPEQKEFEFLTGALADAVALEFPFVSAVALALLVTRGLGLPVPLAFSATQP